ncbi:hypothetical protein Celaphus_00019220 [Cervus elaphus hippelaphus]|uniref:Neuronal membrane glycoprotein M6-a n=1 Tax=Cervus elaphus hippelaphus TaxID=46360 RepID=A0A212C2Y1_CEREH|nr:hypothetical protein Celaphus_00019220 [Cervus elaphus hippelaphus]
MTSDGLVHPKQCGTEAEIIHGFLVTESECFTFKVSNAPSVIDIFKYVIYGIAAAFFVYGILLMVEGFFTTGAIKDLYGDFKITTCGRCKWK